MNRICIDFDSTLNNNDEAWCAWASAKFGQKVERKDLLDWDFMGRTFGPEVFGFFSPQAYIEHIVPIPGSLRFVRQVEAMFGKENVLIVTSSVPGTEEVKNQFIATHYNICGERVVHAKHKTPHSKDSFLVDDYPEHILGHVEENNSPGIVFNLGGVCPIGFLDNYDQSRIEAAIDLITVAHTYDDILTLIEERRAA